MRQTTNKRDIPKIEPMTQIAARVTTKTQDRLIEIASKKGKRYTSFIREILENYVKNYDL